MKDLMFMTGQNSLDQWQKKYNSKENQEDEAKKEISDAATLESEEHAIKRPLDEDELDSDTEIKRKKPKKKKKQAIPTEDTEGTGKKNKKSIRQMKKEKHAQRQADAALAAKDQLKTQCLSYLSQWKHDRQNWKFMKAKQVWLYKNKFSKQLIPEQQWPLLLEYFESAQGNIRKMLLDDANKVIKEMDDWTESQNENDGNDENEIDEDTKSSKPDISIYNRARSLIQCLQE
ncbi:unnamed protein product [Leptosia nina]|uniref:WKF domain-containing protein n=1 Tax=Leptosia nina TaxID=320188 RepID=A0AAV1K3C9_9NEOP